MDRWLTRFLRDEGGATAIEYAIILATIFLAIIGAMTLFANNATAKFNEATTAIVSAGSGS